MEKYVSDDAKIVLHLDPCKFSMKDIVINRTDSFSEHTCLVFFSESDAILRDYAECLDESIGKKINGSLIKMIDKESPCLFGFHIFYADPMSLASQFEEVLNRPNFFDRYVLHIVLTKEPIQSFLDIRDLSSWKKKFLIEVKKQLKIPSTQIHGLMPSKENLVTSLYDLDRDVSFLCLIALHRYSSKNSTLEHREVNFVNLLMQLNKEKNPSIFCTQDFPELCLHYARYLHNAAVEAEDFYKLAYANTSNCLVRIFIERCKGLGKIQLPSSYIEMVTTNDTILKETKPQHVTLKKLIRYADNQLGELNDLSKSDFKKPEELLNKAKEIIEKDDGKIPSILFNELTNAYRLASFKLCYKKAMNHKKNNHHLDAFVHLRRALTFLTSSSEKNNYRQLAVIHHHLGLINNLVNDETCNEYLVDAIAYYEQANMPESAQKVKATLYRIELNLDIKEHPNEEKECCFNFWNSAIQQGDMVKFRFIHSYLQKNSDRLKLNSTTEHGL